jgi:WD40 repeat protein
LLTNAVFNRPQDLLEDNKKHQLKGYSQYQSPDPIYSTALYPGFGVGKPDNALVLYAARDTPIQLRHAFHLSDSIYGSYRWNDPNTEAAITPHSLIFTADATHFVAGSKAQFAIYDVARPSDSQIRVRKTSKSRYALKTFGADPGSCATSPHSIITAMDISEAEDILAVGTNTRHVALYGDHGLGDLITTFKLPTPETAVSTVRRGVTQVKWSLDGTYLFIAERQSDTVEVYDIRQSYKRLSWLSGRKAEVNFQMAFDVVPTVHGLEIWAGGTDGFTKMWSNPEQQEGELVPSEQFRVHQGMFRSECLQVVGLISH